MAHILIVDDDDEIATLWGDILETKGHTHERAAAAYGALLRGIRTHFDLVIMDLLLQGANGAVAAAALRGVGIMAPIVVVTGGLLPIDQAVYERIGFAGRLLKPVHMNDLLGEVDRQLAKIEREHGHSTGAGPRDG